MASEQEKARYEVLREREQTTIKILEAMSKLDQEIANMYDDDDNDSEPNNSTKETISPRQQDIPPETQHPTYIQNESLSVKQRILKQRERRRARKMAQQLSSQQTIEEINKYFNSEQPQSVVIHGQPDDFIADSLIELINQETLQQPQEQSMETGIPSAEYSEPHLEQIEKIFELQPKEQHKDINDLETEFLKHTQGPLVITSSKQPIRRVQREQQAKLLQKAQEHLDNLRKKTAEQNNTIQQKQQSGVSLAIRNRRLIEKLQQRRQEEQEKQQKKEDLAAEAKERKKLAAEKRHKGYNELLLSIKKTKGSTTFNLHLPTRKKLGPILKTISSNSANFALRLRTRVQKTLPPPLPVSPILPVVPLKPFIMPQFTKPIPIYSENSSVKPNPNPKPPTPINAHNKIIELMKIFGYPQNGVCLGIASMASQAALLGEQGIKQFNTRINTINTQYKILKNKIKLYADKENTLEILEKKRQQISQTNTEVSLTLTGPRLERLNNLISRLTTELKKIREDIIDLRAFFDGIYIYQKTLSPETADAYQQIVSIPTTFDTIKPDDPDTKFPLKYELKRADAPFLGCFSKKELSDFLQDFNTHLQNLLKSSKNQSIIFHIGNINHDTAIIYDQNLNQYFFVDANFTDPNNLNMLIPFNPNEMPKLADYLFTALAKENNETSSIAISIDAYLNNQYQLPIEQITQLGETPLKKQWAAALTRNDSTANNSTLLQLASIYKNPNLIESLIKSFDQETKNTELIRAVYQKDISLIKTLLLYEADFNYMFNGDTILRHALYLNDPNLTTCLLQHTTKNPNITEQILYDVTNNHLYALRILLEQGYLEQNNKDKALLYAIHSNNIEAVELLLLNGADINYKINNDTILIHAMSLNNPQVISKLMAHTTSTIIVDKKILTYAINTNNVQLLRYLLSKNTNQDIINDALSIAIYAKHLEMTKELLLLGANINHTINNDSILTHAISLKNHDIIDCILQHTKYLPKIHQNTLSHAVDLNNKNLISYLLLNGELLDQDTQKQALLYAIKENNQEWTQALLTKQPMFVSIDQKIVTAAINSNNDTILQLLVKHGQLDETTKNDILLQMVYTNKMVIVQELLQQGADVNVQDPNGYTILTRALSLKNSKMINILLNYAPNIDEHALDYAIEWGDLNIIANLLSQPNMDKDIIYNALIYEILYSQRIEIIDLLLNKIKQSREFNEAQDLLQYAIHSKNLEIIKRVIAYTNSIEQTTLDHAIELNNPEIIRLLLKEGNCADENTLDTALAHAIYLVDIQLVNKLLGQKIDINSNIHGKTILMHAIDAQDINMIKFLLKQPKIKINEETLKYALASNDEETIKFLLRKGTCADENTLDTALVHAIRLMDIPLVNKLLKQKIDINSSIHGKTILMHAIDAQNTAMIKFLLKQPNIEINEETFNYSLKLNNMEIIKILSSSSKLNPSAQNKALIYMMRMGDIATVKLLLNKITDINHNVDGKLILIHSIDINNTEMIKLLLQQTNVLIDEKILDYAKQKQTTNNLIIKLLSKKMHQQNLKIALEELNPDLFTKLFQSIPDDINRKQFLQLISNKLELIPNNNDPQTIEKIKQIQTIISKFQEPLTRPDTQHSTSIQPGKIRRLRQ